MIYVPMPDPDETRERDKGQCDTFAAATTAAHAAAFAAKTAADATNIAPNGADTVRCQSRACRIMATSSVRAPHAQLAMPMIGAHHQSSSMSCNDAGKWLSRCAGEREARMKNAVRLGSC
eukprot:920288-Prymnesium_polylepis.1